MITLQQFIKFIEEHGEELKPAELRDYELKIMLMHKVNETLHGVSMQLKGQENCTSASIVYIEHYYNEFRRSKTYTVFDVVRKMFQDIIHNSKTLPDIKQMYLAANITKDTTVEMRLVNYERNIEMLQELPHRKFLDLAVIYQIPLETHNDDWAANITITNEYAQLLGITEEELFNKAMQYVVEKYPAKIIPMNALLPMQYVLDMYGLKDEDFMYVCANFKFKNGATTMLYEGVLRDFANKIGHDLIILPSSLHELILIADVDRDYAQLRDIVQEINQTELADADFLSNNIYKYSRDTDKITIIENEA